jgi:hypothetical protein
MDEPLEFRFAGLYKMFGLFDRSKVIADFYRHVNDNHPLVYRELVRSNVRVIDAGRKGLQTVIAVSETTTHDEIRDSARLAVTVRDLLVQWQGYRLPEAVEALLYVNDSGMSYATIAEKSNMLIKTCLENHLAMRRERAAADKSDIAYDLEVIDKYEDQPRWELARALLLALRYDEAEVNDRLKEWLEFIPSNEYFSDNVPIDRAKVISALKYWQNKRERGG